jgi:hypothetical protein
MNKAQEIDYAYQEEKLLRLLARRQNLPTNSDQIRCQVSLVKSWRSRIL